MYQTAAPGGPHHQQHHRQDGGPEQLLDPRASRNGDGPFGGQLANRQAETGDGQAAVPMEDADEAQVSTARAVGAACMGTARLLG